MQSNSAAETTPNQQRADDWRASWIPGHPKLRLYRGLAPPSSPFSSLHRPDQRLDRDGRQRAATTSCLASDSGLAFLSSRPSLMRRGAGNSAGWQVSSRPAVPAAGFLLTRLQTCSAEAGRCKCPRSVDRVPGIPTRAEDMSRGQERSSLVATQASRDVD